MVAGTDRPPRAAHEADQHDGPARRTRTCASRGAASFVRLACPVRRAGLSHNAKVFSRASSMMRTWGNTRGSRVLATGMSRVEPFASGVTKEGAAMRTIAIINQKGGCGKTTTSINLAACMARLGQRTLLVDMDPQGHCGVGLAVPEEQIERTIYDCMIEEKDGKVSKLSDIVWQIASDFDLA